LLTDFFLVVALGILITLVLVLGDGGRMQHVAAMTTSLTSIDALTRMSTVDRALRAFVFICFAARRPAVVRTQPVHDPTRTRQSLIATCVHAQ
jgi:hypothetical protein